MTRHPRSSRGVFLEAILKAERGVASCGGGSQPRPGRPGTPPARHYDLAARSSLYGSGGNAGDQKRGPRPKIATVERREARVSRWRRNWRAALRHAAGAAAPARCLGAPPPLGGGKRNIRRDTPGKGEGRG